MPFNCMVLAGADPDDPQVLTNKLQDTPFKVVDIAIRQVPRGEDSGGPLPETFR